MPDPQGGKVTILPRPQSPSRGYGFYGPGAPIPPVVEGQAIRQWDFMPGVNTTQTPRHMEPFSFGHLRAFANVELVRLAIETRKDQLENQNWMIKPREGRESRGQTRDARAIEIEKFLAKPDGEMPFASFMRALDEDLLAIDAPAIECRRTRGGKLLGLELVDGATINLLVDESGRRPRGSDATAFQQVVRGVVWAELANRDLLYLPRNVRTNHIYGFGPVEQIIVTINTILRRQSSQLGYFTEGNVPAGILNAPEEFTNEQIRDLQEWFDQKIAGNQGEQRKLIWVPKDSKYQAFKDSPLKDDFDEWLARVVAFAFSLPPTPFVRQMNKGTAGADQERALEEGLEPLKLWRKRWLDDLIAIEFNAPDLEFAYREDVETDPGKQCEIDDKRLRNGSATLDEVRDRAGDDPYPGGLGAKPLVYIGNALVPVDKVEAMAEKELEPPVPPVAQAPGQEAAPASGKKPKSQAEKLAKAAKIPPPAALALSIDRPKAVRARVALAKAIAPILAEAGIEAAAEVERALAKAERDPKLQAAAIALSIDLKVMLGLSDSLEEELGEIGADAARLALASVGVDAESDLVNQVNGAAVAYAKDRAAELVSADGDESLIASTREMIRGVIAAGLEENVGRAEIADRIQAATAFSEYRAGLIADTEIAMANGAAKAGAWRAVERDGAEMLKQWFASGDEGVCPECELNEAEGEIAFNDEFDSGDDMEPAHPGCRCVTVARVLEPGEAADE